MVRNTYYMTCFVLINITFLIPLCNCDYITSENDIQLNEETSVEEPITVSKSSKELKYENKDVIIIEYGNYDKKSSKLKQMFDIPDDARYMKHDISKQRLRRAANSTYGSLYPTLPQYGTPNNYNQAMHNKYPYMGPGNYPQVQPNYSQYPAPSPQYPGYNTPTNQNYHTSNSNNSRPYLFNNSQGINKPTNYGRNNSSANMYNYDTTPTTQNHGTGYGINQNSHNVQYPGGKTGQYPQNYGNSYPQNGHQINGQNFGTAQNRSQYNPTIHSNTSQFGPLNPYQQQHNGNNYGPHPQSNTQFPTTNPQFQRNNGTIGNPYYGTTNFTQSRGPNLNPHFNPTANINTNPNNYGPYQPQNSSYQSYNNTTPNRYPTPYNANTPNYPSNTYQPNTPNYGQQATPANIPYTPYGGQNYNQNSFNTTHFSPQPNSQYRPNYGGSNFNNNSKNIPYNGQTTNNQNSYPNHNSHDQLFFFPPNSTSHNQNYNSYPNKNLSY